MIFSGPTELTKFNKNWMIDEMISDTTAAFMVYLCVVFSDVLYNPHDDRVIKLLLQRNAFSNCTKMSEGTFVCK